MSAENTTLTDEQVHQIYKSLEPIDKESTTKLSEAEQKTESTEYNEITAINQNEINNIVPTESAYKEVFSEYDLTNEEVEHLINLSIRFRDNKEGKYYDELPNQFKKLADDFVLSDPSPKNKITKDAAARFLLENWISDAKFNTIMDEYQQEMNKTIIEMNSEYNQILTDAFDESFKRIDEIKTEDPALAETLIKVKHAFDSATSFDIQKEFIKNTNPKKIDKWTSRFNDEVFYFNKKVNTTDVKIPDIAELVPIIDNATHHELDIEKIKKFIVVIVRSTMKMNVSERKEDLAYIYRMISTIFHYRYIDLDDDGKAIFDNISSVVSML